MSASLVVPGPLRDLTDGRTCLALGGAGDDGPATVGEALDTLRVRHPALYHRIVTETGEVRPHVNLFVGREDVRWTGGLATPLPPGGELVVLPSVSGG